MFKNKENDSHYTQLCLLINSLEYNESSLNEVSLIGFNQKLIVDINSIEDIKKEVSLFFLSAIKEGDVQYINKDSYYKNYENKEYGVFLHESIISKTNKNNKNGLYISSKSLISKLFLKDFELIIVGLKFADIDLDISKLNKFLKSNSNGNSNESLKKVPAKNRLKDLISNGKLSLLYQYKYDIQLENKKKEHEKEKERNNNFLINQDTPNKHDNDKIKEQNHDNNKSNSKNKNIESSSKMEVEDNSNENETKTSDKQENTANEFSNNINTNKTQVIVSQSNQSSGKKFSVTKGVAKSKKHSQSNVAKKQAQEMLENALNEMEEYKKKVTSTGNKETQPLDIKDEDLEKMFLNNKKRPGYLNENR